jgi:hypothetical protein
MAKKSTLKEEAKHEHESLKKEKSEHKHKFGREGKKGKNPFKGGK